MTRLVAALQRLGLAADITLAGRWAEIPGDGCTVYVIETARSDGYFTWCGDPRARAIAFYRDPVEAIEAGLRRAARLSKGDTSG